MTPDYVRSPLAKAVIGSSSTTGVQIGNSSTQLLAIYNCSATNQVNALAIYDAPSVAAAVGGGYPPLYQPVLSAGQVIDMTIQDRGFKINNSIVAIPAGISNSDGGWMLIYT